MSDGSVFHEGETAVQRAAGEEAGALQNSTMIADRVMPQAQRFVHGQRMLAAASRDVEGDLWATLLFGEAGFASIESDGRLLQVDRSASYSFEEDSFWRHLAIGAPVGFLAIDLATRHRLRINGHVESLTDEQLLVRVEQAYPNCPKYIQRRRLLPSPSKVKSVASPVNGVVPDAVLLTAIRRADTFFVASGHPTRGLDVSHRGGHPGFVGVMDSNTLRVPDYAGNSMFNTLGNFAVDARCGLTVVDFDAGQLHQMTGDVAAHFGRQNEDADPACTGRFWDFRIRRWRTSSLASSLKWEFVDYSAYNPTCGGDFHRS